ncbi:hypothetical protein FRC02_007215 [Tulasnella sp. 418]|nr:hypothetical protein FRC02_007215 [Tulasnella sp. 418]
MLLVKLTYNGIIRKESFPSRPTWDALAVKIEALFAIPASQVAVTYTDPDGDLITMSSQDEPNHLKSIINNEKFALIAAKIVLWLISLGPGSGLCLESEVSQS